MCFASLIRLLEGVSYINSLKDDEFQQIIDLVDEFRKNHKEDKSLEIDQLELPFEIENQLLVIKSTYYLLERLSLYVMKPSSLQKDLKSILNFDDSKSTILIKSYCNQTKVVLSNDFDRAEGVTTNIKAKLSTEPEARSKSALGIVEIHSSGNKKLNLELKHSDLLEFFDQIESIQNELNELDLLFKKVLAITG